MISEKKNRSQLPVYEIDLLYCTLLFTFQMHWFLFGVIKRILCQRREHIILDTYTSSDTMKLPALLDKYTLQNFCTRSHLIDPRLNYCSFTKRTRMISLVLFKKKLFSENNKMLININVLHLALKEDTYRFTDRYGRNIWLINKRNSIALHFSKCPCYLALCRYIDIMLKETDMWTIIIDNPSDVNLFD